MDLIGWCSVCRAEGGCQSACSPVGGFACGFLWVGMGIRDPQPLPLCSGEDRDGGEFSHDLVAQPGRLRCLAPGVIPAAPSGTQGEGHSVGKPAASRCGAAHRCRKSEPVTDVHAPRQPEVFAASCATQRGVRERAPHQSTPRGCPGLWRGVGAAHGADSSSPSRASGEADMVSSATEVVRWAPFSFGCVQVQFIAIT